MVLAVVRARAGRGRKAGPICSPARCTWSASARMPPGNAGPAWMRCVDGSRVESGHPSSRLQYVQPGRDGTQCTWAGVNGGAGTPPKPSPPTGTSARGGYC